jgi:hypothetical protein
MLPFLPFTYVLRFFWEGLSILVWLALGYSLYSLLVQYVGLLAYLAAMFAAFLVWGAMLILRPMRKPVLLFFYKTMVGVPFRPVTELGIWKLLLVADRFWRAARTDYVGIVAFSEAYKKLSKKGRMRCLLILWFVDRTGRPHLAKASRSFLREVNAPMDPASSELVTS